MADTLPNPNQGASGCDLATIRALTRQGHEVETVWGPDMPHRLKHGNLHQLLELPRNYAVAMAKKCQTTHYDVVQINQPQAFLAAREYKRLGYKGICINRSHGWEPHVEYAMSRYGDENVDLRPAWRRCASMMIQFLLLRHNEMVVRYSDGLVMCSVDDQEYLGRRHPEMKDRVLTLAPGLAEDFVSTPMRRMTNERSRRILHVGSFSRHKAPFVVARVLKGVLNRHADATATWVCEKINHNKIRELMGPALGRVTLLDWMPRETLRNVYDEHGIFLFPSYFEGFSLAFLEAMSRGLCVLASNIDGMRQVIKDGCNGFLFDRGDSDAMAERAGQLINKIDICLEISRNARKTAVKFTWERTARELTIFYGRLLRIKSVPECDEKNWLG